MSHETVLYLVMKTRASHPLYDLHILAPSTGVDYLFKTVQAGSASPRSSCTLGTHAAKPYSFTYTFLISSSNSMVDFDEFCRFLECHTVWSGKRIWLTDVLEDTEDGERFPPKRLYLSPTSTMSHRTETWTSVNAMIKLEPGLYSFRIVSILCSYLHE